MNKLIKLPNLNKKADLSVVVFVFLVALLCGFTLYSMAINKNKVEQRIVGFEIAEEMLLEKKDIEYRLTKPLKNV